MAYGKIYEFIFESSNGANTKIEVFKDGFSGTAIQRALGSAPVLRQQFSGCVAGSSLAFTPECLVDGEFSQFYTTDAKEFRVDLYRNSTKIWSGFIVPELYSEPDIAPPYDVSITAADGLGELKRYDFLPLGKVTLQALFTNLLGYTGQSLPLNFISALTYTGASATAFFLNTYIDIDYKAGENCYDVLQYLLATFHARICYYAGAWLIARENDITFTNGKPAYINQSGQASSYTGGLMNITAMGAGGLWPVDFTSSSVDPALRSVRVRAPWNLVSGLVNSGMTSDTAWTKTGSASYNTALMGYSLLPYASISQSKSQLMSKPLLLAIEASAYIYRLNSLQQYSQAILEVTFTSGGSTWYLVEDDEGGISWSTTSGTIKYRIESGDSRGTATRNEVNVPEIYNDNDQPVSGTLNIKISADQVQGLRLFGAYLTVAAEDGYLDTLQLNNGARGEADEVEIAVGHETSELNNHKDYYGGILLTSNNSLVTSLSTGNWSNLDFLSLISRDYARSIALPRLRTDGTLNTPSSLALRPLLVNYRGTNRWIETFEWNLLEDNFDFSALSLPSASITVSGETIVATGSASGSAANTIGRFTPGAGGEGEDGLTIMLSNYAHVFEASSSGYALQSSDTIYVLAFRGATQLATTVGTITGQQTGLTASVSNNGTTNTSVAVAVTSSLHVTGTLVIPVTADGMTVNLRYGWSLAPKGATGNDGMTTAWVTIYKRSATTPALPRFNVTYNFANGTITGDLDGWSLLPPDTDSAHNPLWMATALAYGSGASTTISSWNGPVKYVEDGSAGSSKPMRGPTEYSSSFQYSGMQGAGDFVDLVTYNGDTTKMYYCKLTPPGAGYPPTNTTYWEETTWQDFVATKVLFANYAFVKNFGANAVKIANAGGTVTGGFMPPSTDGNGNTIFWAGGSTPSNAKFTIDNDGNINATSGTFSGFLRMPFESISTACTYTSGNYYLADKCNIYVPALSTSLYLPCTADQIGKVVNIWDFPVKTQSTVNGFYIRTQVANNLYIASSTSTYGLQAKSYFNTGHGGYLQLVAVPGVGSAAASWIVTVNSCGGYTVG